MNLKLANIVSMVFNPLLIIIFLPFFLVYKATNNFESAYFWTGYTLIFLLAIGVFIFFAVRRRVFTDPDVSKREQRPLLFSVFIVCGIIYLLGLILLHAPRILFFTIISIIVCILIASLVNTKIKASLHVGTITTLILGLIFAYGHYYILLLLLIPLVGWSRVKLKRHTIKEVIVGGVLGCLLLLGIYGFYEVFLRR